MIAEKLFKKNIDISRADIRKMGYYPMLTTLKILDKSLGEVVSQNRERVLKRISRFILKNESLLPSCMDIRDEKLTENFLYEAFQRAFKKEAIQFNKKMLRDLGYESLDEFSAEKQKDIRLLRKLARTIIEDESLLNRCLKLKEQDRERQYIAWLIKDACLKGSIGADETEIARCLDYFVSLNYGHPEFRAVFSYYDFNDPHGELEYKRNFYSVLCEHADSYFQTKYLLEQYANVKEFYQTFFPIIFQEIPLRLRIIYNPVKVQRRPNTVIVRFISLENAGLNWNLDPPVIEIISAEDLSGKRNYGELETVIQHQRDYKFLRRNVDFSYISHEISHALFSFWTNAPPRNMTVSECLKTCYSVLSEGLATFMEMTTTDLVLKNAKDLGLNERDIRDFEHYKLQRAKNLRQLRRFLKEVKKEIALLENNNKRTMCSRDLQIKILTIRDPELLEQYLLSQKAKLKAKNELAKRKNNAKIKEEIEDLELEIDVLETSYKRKMHLEDLQLDKAILDNPKLRKGRIKELKRELLEGAAGTYVDGVRFFQKLYKKEGLEGIFRLVKTLDGEKLLEVKRSSQEYQKLMKNPKLLEKFCKNS